jgi:hypothetical protein
MKLRSYFIVIHFYNLSEMHFTIELHDNFYNLSVMHFTIKLCDNFRLHELFQKVT